MWKVSKSGTGNYGNSRLLILQKKNKKQKQTYEEPRQHCSHALTEVNKRWLLHQLVQVVL